MNYINNLEVRIRERTPEKNISVNCSDDIPELDIIKQLKQSDREQLICLHLNVRNKITGYEVVSKGSISSSIVHPREVFKSALMDNSASIIVVHNHPSGDPGPSLDDKLITKRLAKAGKILGIELLDHIIVAPGADFFSFKYEDII